ncbi:hypothetical protein [uncultured Nostoc sp.]|uniref:hypothetical protein n=1 Tax=uncultured Nostoc sp. TaxID=340711 RepID=UPI0035CC3B5E
MKTSKSLTILTICALSAFTIPFAMNLRQANAYPKKDCDRFAVGTYLITLSGASSARELLTLTQDGNFFASDSSQAGISGTAGVVGQPFGNIQGRWKCTGNREITVTALNFGFPTGTLSASVVRDDYHITFDSTTHAVQGTLTFRSFPLNANPLNRNNDSSVKSFTATFTGQRINAD